MLAWREYRNVGEPLVVSRTATRARATGAGRRSSVRLLYRAANLG